jgi:hypothetical protein
VKYWEIIANKIIKAGFSVGWVSALDDYGRTVWTVDAHRDGKRFVVRADEKLAAFLDGNYVPILMPLRPRPPIGGFRWG